MSTNEIDDAESHISSTFRLNSLFFSLICTNGSPPWVMLVATAVVASETFFVAFFFGKSCARVCFVALHHSWIRCMSFFCSPSTCDLASNNWNSVGTSGLALEVPLLSLFWNFRKSKRDVVRLWRDIRDSCVCLTLQRLKQNYSPSVYYGFETYFCQTSSSSVRPSSHEYLLWRQAIQWKQSSCLSGADDLAITATTVLLAAAKIFSLLNLALLLLLGLMCIQVESM